MGALLARDVDRNRPPLRHRLLDFGEDRPAFGSAVQVLALVGSAGVTVDGGVVDPFLPLWPHAAAVLAAVAFGVQPVLFGHQALLEGVGVVVLPGRGRR